MMSAAQFNGCLYSAAPWASLSGAPICALEHLQLMQPCFDEVCLLLCEHGPLEDRACQEGIPVRCFPLEFRGLRKGGLWRWAGGLWAVFRSRWVYVRELSRQLRRCPGILHIHSLSAHLPYALLAGRLAGVPVTVTVHEPWTGGIEARIDLIWIRLLATQVIFLTRAMVAQYPRMLRRQPFVVYNSCLQNAADVRVPHAVPRILLAARLGKAKGTDVFLAVCRLLKERGVRFEAWLAGKWLHSEEQEEAQAYIRRNHLEDVVQEKGAVVDMDSLYAETDILLFPSRRDSFPRVVMEAMNHGVPVVATAVDGIPEMVESGVTGFLVKSGDVEEFADTVERLLKEDGLRAQMGRASRELAASRFSPERYRAELTEVYRLAGAGS